MSTDSSELTFVRCPSCRSLVPAASSRCKMCGASLDASAQPDQSEEERKKSGRVRQHTMTQASSELSSAADQARGQDFPEDEIDDDPFDIFDMDEEEDLESPKEEAPVSAAAPDEEDAVTENPLSSFLPEDEEPQPAAAAVRKTQQPPPPAQPKSAAPPAAPPAPKQHATESNHASRREEREPIRPKVSIESGGRPQGKPSNLSFSKKADAATQESPAPAPVREKSPPVVERAPQHQSTKGDTQKMASEKGKLIGWFVSYDKADGSAIELREGRFFISGSQLKPNDLVLANSNLSTPHALASISLSGGFKVQDLMSDGGLFVRKKNASSYSKEESSVQLDHGDWVKFGDVEFLVALISNGK